MTPLIESLIPTRWPSTCHPSLGYRSCKMPAFCYAATTETRRGVNRCPLKYTAASPIAASFPPCREQAHREGPHTPSSRTTLHAERHPCSNREQLSPSRCGQVFFDATGANPQKKPSGRQRQGQQQGGGWITLRPLQCGGENRKNAVPHGGRGQVIEKPLLATPLRLSRLPRRRGFGIPGHTHPGHDITPAATKLDDTVPWLRIPAASCRYITSA